MTMPKMEPKFANAFKDPRFLLTMVGIIATAGIAYYRLGQVEVNQKAAEKEFEDFQARFEDDQRRTKERLRIVESKLAEPRFTLEDFTNQMKRREERQEREADRIAKWMADQNAFRLQMVEFATESRAATTELRGLIEDLKDSER